MFDSPSKVTARDVMFDKFRAAACRAGGGAFVYLDHASATPEGHSSATRTFAEAHRVWCATLPPVSFVAVSRDQETVVELARQNGARTPGGAELRYKIGELRDVVKAMARERVCAVWVDLCATKDDGDALGAAVRTLARTGGAVGVTLTCRGIGADGQTKAVRAMLRAGGVRDVCILQYESAGGKPVILGLGTVAQASDAPLAKEALHTPVAEKKAYFGCCNRPLSAGLEKVCTLKNGHLGPCDDAACDDAPRTVRATRGTIAKRARGASSPP